MKKFDTTNYAAPVTMTNSATMPARALGPKDIARAFDKWHKRHRVADRETARRVWDAAADYYGRVPVAAIAPPVAAGSVDTSGMQRYTPDMVGEMVEHVEGDYVLHADAIAWGAQQREQGKAEEKDFIKECMVRGQDEFNRKWTEQKERAEKVEAELAQVNQWYRTAHQISEDLAARILKADDRIEELETEIKVLHRG